MLKPHPDRSFGAALEIAISHGVQSPSQIKQAVRRRGTWFLIYEVQK